MIDDSIYRRLFEASTDAELVIDPAGQIVVANPAAHAMFGYPAGSLPGQPLTVLLPRELHAAHAEHLALFRLEGDGTRGMNAQREVIGRHRDGRDLVLEVSISKASAAAGMAVYSASVRDVTERKRLERRLRDSEANNAKLAMVAERTDNMVIITDAHGRAEWANSAFTRHTGFRVAELLGRKPGELLQGAGTDRSVVDLVRRAIGAGAPVSVEILNYRKDRQPYWVQLDIVPVHDPASHELRHFVSVQQVITARREAAAALARHRDELEQEVARRTAELDSARAAAVRAQQAAERASEAKSEFLANMSHEIRTPLGAVIGLADLLGTAALDDKQRERLGHLQAAARSLLGIVDDILDYSRIEAGRLEIRDEPFELREQVGRLHHLFAAQAAAKGIDLDVAVAPELPAFVRGDPLRFSQVLFNLVGNAIKFTEHGRVAVTVAPEAAAGSMPQLRVVVNDSGIGMSGDQLQRLFQPFVQGDGSIARRYGGSGLGLTISHRLVELMAGTMQVDSAPGVGSTFTVRLPLVADVAPALPPTPSAAALRFDDVHVLVVEDNLVNRIVAEELLRSIGATVTVAENGADALALYNGGQGFDLVLMDMQMPVLDGLETTRRLRRHPGGLNVPVVALTANVTPDDRRRCLEAGMNDLLGKPYTREQLGALLQRMLRGATRPVRPDSPN